MSNKLQFVVLTPLAACRSSY